MVALRHESGNKSRTTDFEQTEDLEGSLDRIFDQLRLLFLREYKRGRKEAADRILHIAETTIDTAPEVTGAARQVIERAPRGAARAFVEKTMTNIPITIQELRAGAATDMERILSYQTLRLELERGRKEKRYKKVGKKWSLNPRR